MKGTTLFFFTLLGLGFCLPIGFKTTISESGLEYGREVGIKLLEQAIQTLRIPDVTSSAGKNYQ